MAFEYSSNEPLNVKHWDTYKVLNKIKETIHHKRKLVKDSLVEDNARANKSLIETRIKGSNRELSELVRDGTELITNVNIANDRRELKHRDVVAKERYDLLNELRAESQLADEKLANIAALWSELDGYKDPISLNNGLETLKLQIKDLLNQKDGVIDQLHSTLANASDRYESSQICKDEDVQCLIERIDMHVEVMKESYQNHLALLHQSIDDERVSFKQRHTNKWNDLYSLREETEQQNLTDIKERNEVYDNVAFKVQLEHEEMCRNTRIRLDRDNEKLQIQLRNINAETMLNTEKLNYNHHVLQKRTEENVTVRHQQKQRLARMHNAITDIRNNIDRTKQDHSDEIRKCSQDVAKLYENVKNLKQKSETLATSNDQKFENMWDMYEMNCYKQMREILGIDRIMHEQVLELVWHEPPMRIKTKNELKSIQKATFHVRALVEGERTEDGATGTPKSSPQTSDNGTGSIALKYMIDEICKQTQWLLDEKLDTLLQPYPEVAESNFVQIDNVFEALHIQNAEGLNELKGYFRQVGRCQQCIVPNEQLVEETEGSSSTLSATTKAICHDPSHRWLIDANSVLPTLERYLNDRKERLIRDEQISDSAQDNQNSNVLSTLSRLIDSKDIELFWESFRPNFPDTREFLWHTLNTGLNKYLLVLKKRHKLDAQCDFLRSQNNELKHMLLQYLPS